MEKLNEFVIVELIKRMKTDAEDWRSEDDIDLRLRYGLEVNKIGKIPFLTTLFKNYSSGTLQSLLVHFMFTWKDINYSQYKEILINISDNIDALYHFIVFSGHFLALDVKKEIESNPMVSLIAKDYVIENFSKGTPEPDSLWAKNCMEENNLDYYGLWYRLKKEGAPMKV